MEKSLYPNVQEPMKSVWDTRPFGFAQAVVCTGPSRRIYLSGQAAVDRDGVVQHLGNKKAQLRLCFANVVEILGTLGATLDDVVKCSIVVANYSPERDLDELTPVWGELMGAKMACSLFGCQSLALPGLEVEIEVTAEVPV